MPTSGGLDDGIAIGSRIRRGWPSVRTSNDIDDNPRTTGKARALRAGERPECAARAKTTKPRGAAPNRLRTEASERPDPTTGAGTGNEGDGETTLLAQHPRRQI